MDTPIPGKPVRGSTSGRPIMALLDLLGRRWTLRVLWELREGPLTFRQIQDRCDAMSPSVLNQCIAELRKDALVEKGTDGYCLTDDGKQLLHHLAPLDQWAKNWAKKL